MCVYIYIYIYIHHTYVEREREREREREHISGNLHVQGSDSVGLLRSGCSLPTYEQHI